MYEGKYVYPALKHILQSRLRFQGGIERLLATCREHCPDACWDTIAAYDYDAELARFVAWYKKEVVRKLPPDDIEVVWLAPHDLPDRCDFRGSSQWSRDPEDWQWFYHDDYHLLKSYDSLLVSAASELTEEEGISPKRKSPANSPYQVVELFYSLGLYGLCLRQLIRTVEPKQLLSKRTSRWFVVGHPDSVYGVILGTLTRSRWQTFHG